MTREILVRGIAATLEFGVWKCQDSETLRLLRFFELPKFAYYPDRDHALIALIDDTLGDLVTVISNPIRKSKPGRIY